MEIVINKKNRTLQPRVYSLVPTLLRMAASGGGAGPGPGCPSYTAPAGNALEHNFTLGYSIPLGNNVQIDFCTTQ